MKQFDLFGMPSTVEEVVPSIPYMGNKRKLAKKIINEIYKIIGEFDNLYDIFGGGGAVSVAGLLEGHKVYYNELNTGVANLMRYIKDGGEIPFNWVSREEFNKNKDRNDWYG